MGFDTKNDLLVISDNHLNHVPVYFFVMVEKYATSFCAGQVAKGSSDSLSGNHIGDARPMIKQFTRTTQ